MKIAYWIVTIIFGGFMLFSAYPDIVSDPKAAEFFNALKMPHSLLPFLGIAKALGVIVILIPKFPRLKEWAYAGLMFDLIGAAYLIYNSTPDKSQVMGGIAFIAAVIVVGFASYFLYHKVRAPKVIG